MSQRVRSAKRAKSATTSQWVQSATPIRSKKAQARFVETAKKLGASPKVIAAAQKG